MKAKEAAKDGICGAQVDLDVALAVDIQNKCVCVYISTVYVYMIYGIYNHSIYVLCVCVLYV